MLPSRKIYFFLFISEALMHLRLFSHAILSYVSEQNTKICTLSPYLTEWIKYMFVKTFIVCSVVDVFQSLYLGKFILFLSLSIIFNLAIAAAFLLGRNSVATGFSLPLPVSRLPFVRWTPSRSTPQLSSSGYKCCIAHSKYDLLVLTRTARTVLSGPGNRSVIIPNIHFPFFR